MDTVTLQIGNTDDKLTQEEWSAYCACVDEAVSGYAAEVHFRGFANPDSPRQNACWVFDLEARAELRGLLVRMRHSFAQDSVAWTEGCTEFL